MNGSDRLKIAVFIDFDNIEIGVKSTLNRHFDVGTVLEAIKERGEVVTKVAYGDWKRAGDHSRSMTQHAIQMVQRNLTPGGDKNGADINLALDALEMAFTRNHINAFVIVGGDSDFMALVEKLKQYDKKVLVVGGRSFTSTILQKNCHEFIAYENLIAAPQASSRRPAERARSSGPGDANLSKALPLVRRALKVLSDREVSPQLGLLKSTLLQLDSTFTERDYGASTFRDFIEKMAAAGYVNLKQVDRSLLVELKDGAVADEEEPPQPGAELAAAAPAAASASGGTSSASSTPAVVSFPSPSAPSAAQLEEGVRALFDAFQNAKNPPHWPMYLRNVKQYVKNAAPTFDERRYGFANFLEAVRAAGRSGLFRLERNRQGILRIFAGNQFPRAVPVPVFDIENELAAAAAEPAVEADGNIEEETMPVGEELSPVIVEELPVSDEAPVEEEKPAPRRRTRVASTSAKKKPAVARKTKKKTGTDSEPF
ncbi:MAG TPA: NYN domain-containing protein [Terriglobia bacterium]|nr:NYN domain-containing protein [Terriglobia bacterium]